MSRVGRTRPHSGSPAPQPGHTTIPSDGGRTRFERKTRLRTLPVPVRALRLESSVRGLKFHPSGEYLLALTNGNPGAGLWHLETDRMLAWPADLPAPSIAAWSPDGAILALGSAEGGVAVYRFPDGPLIDRFDQPGAVRCLEFSLDGRLLAVAADQVVVRNLAARTFVAGPFDHPARVSHLTFNVRTDRLMTAAMDGQARVFAVPGPSGPLFPPVPNLGRFSSPENPLRPLFVDRDTTFVSLSQNGRLCWRHAETGREIRTTEEGRDIDHMVLSPDQRVLATGASPISHGIELWDVASGKLLGEIAYDGPSGPIQQRRKGTPDRKCQPFRAVVGPSDLEAAEPGPQPSRGRRPRGDLTQQLVHRHFAERWTCSGLGDRAIAGKNHSR